MIAISPDVPPGTIVHVTSGYRYGIGPGRRLGISELIQAVLRDGCHDAIVVRRGEALEMGDMQPVFATTTPFSAYEKRVNTDRASLEFFWPRDATPAQGERAAEWWMLNVYRRKVYNVFAYPLLLAKAIVDPTMDALHWDFDLTWSDWCTESVMWAWLRGANLDPYTGNRKPTPATTRKRAQQGLLTRITDKCLVNINGSRHHETSACDLLPGDCFVI